MKYNYQIIVEYDGTNFIGWQSQKKGLSIQSELQKAIKKLLKNNIKITGSGRTDAGVHAIQQNANFFTNKEILDKNKFVNSINFFLKKKDISIIDVKRKNLIFNARYSAKKRIYRYIIINRVGSLSLEKNKAWHIKKKTKYKYYEKRRPIFAGHPQYFNF